MQNQEIILYPLNKAEIGTAMVMVFPLCTTDFDSFLKKWQDILLWEPYCPDSGGAKSISCLWVRAEEKRYS